MAPVPLEGLSSHGSGVGVCVYVCRYVGKHTCVCVFAGECVCVCVYLSVVAALVYLVITMSPSFPCLGPPAARAQTLSGPCG